LKGNAVPHINSSDLSPGVSMPSQKSGNVAPGFEVPFSRLTPPPLAEAGSGPIAPGRTVLKKGSRIARGGRCLEIDIVLDRDVPIVLRDGTTLRADIYRPGAGPSDSRGVDVPLPTVLAYTPYGKAGGYYQLDLFPGRAGVARSRLTGLQAFEAPDPNDWVRYGYAIAVVDSRGSYHSEGDMLWWGPTAGRDGYDVIEWIAAQPWSNGRVGMTGNSQLAMMQWTIAELRPPHLSAIAPWEGLVDHYNDNLVAGGIPFPEFTDDVQSHAHGSGFIEHMTLMLGKHPFRDGYWESKAPAVEMITVPAYVVASFSNSLHSRGTLDAYRRLGSEEKWLRIHNTMEWSDYYEPRNVGDLRRFFDHYLKGIENGWETTSAVRYCVIDFGGRDTVDRQTSSWPPPGVQHHEMHLNSSTLRLDSEAPLAESFVVLEEPNGKDGVSFTYTFDRDTELVGYGALEVWCSVESSDDLDLFIEVTKPARRNRPHTRVIFDLPRLMKNIMVWAYEAGRVKNAGFAFWRGPSGRIRASRRELDQQASTVAEPRLAHQRDLKLTVDEPVKLAIALWPTSMRWRAGESLQLTITRQDPRGDWFPDVPRVSTINRGRARIHTGGGYDSKLWLPVLHKE